MKKHFHISVFGTYTVEADSLEEAETTVESWFKKADAGVGVEEGDNDHCDLCSNEQPEPVTIIDPSLQAYIDGVALNILHQNYYKSTNGIWCKAEVDECCDDGEGEFWMVDVDFGCQDDTRNERHRERITVNKDKDGNWTMLGLTYPNVISGVESNSYCDCGNTYEWTCKHECPNDRPSTAHPKYEETK